MMKRFFYFLLVFALLAAPAYALIVGYSGPPSGSGGCTENLSGNYGTTTSGDTVYNPGAGGFILYRAATGNTGTLDTLRAELRNANTDQREVIFFVVNSDGGGGEPGTLLYESSPIYDVATNATFAWVSDAPAYCVPSSTHLWYGLQTESASTDVNYSSGSGELRVSTGTFGTVPATWNAGGDTHYSGYDASFYGTF